MNHYIRMAYGESKMSQNNQDWNDPIAGIGQGNAAGLSIWVAVSMQLYNIMWEEGFFIAHLCHI